MHPAARMTLATLATAFAIHAGPTRAEPEITICHMPQDDPGTVETRRVSIYDWPDHKSHGDVRGFCRIVLNTELPAPRDDESPDEDRPAADEDDSAAVGGGEFEAVLCDDRSGGHGRLIEVSETGRISVRPAQCG